MCLTAARAADRAHFGDYASRVDVVPRVVEYHTVTPGGALRHEEHYDSGSIYTFDVMLARPGDDFTGGPSLDVSPGNVAAAAIWSFGLFFTLFILFLKFLPAVAISEVKGVMPQADPHWEGYHKEAHHG